MVGKVLMNKYERISPFFIFYFIFRKISKRFQAYIVKRIVGTGYFYQVLSNLTFLQSYLPCTFLLVDVHMPPSTIYPPPLQLVRRQKYFKGSVQQKLRPRLLYIIRKLFTRPIIAGHKIYIL